MDLEAVLKVLLSRKDRYHLPLFLVVDQIYVAASRLLDERGWF